MAVAKIAADCDRATNPNPTDIEYKIRIQRMQILAGCVTSPLCTECVIESVLAEIWLPSD